MFGRAGQAAVSLVDVEAGRGGFVIDGGPEVTLLGEDVKIAGDVNGDGLDDLLIGGRGENVYVVFGKRDTTSVTTAVIAAGMGGDSPSPRRPTTARQEAT